MTQGEQNLILFQSLIPQSEKLYIWCYDKEGGYMLNCETDLKDLFAEHPDGVKVETDAYTYIIRGSAEKGSAEIYAYVGGYLDSHIEQSQKGIRFVDEHYHEMFRVSDGGRISIDSNNGDEIQERTCRYIDDYHFAVAENNGVWHTSQFAEASREWTVKPLTPAQNKITALMIEPGKIPVKIEITDELTSYQKAVGGYIECVYPWADNVGIICNEEAKIMNPPLPLNRALRTEGEHGDGEIYDVIAGNMLIIGLGDEGDFISLTEKQIQTYAEKFKTPEKIMVFDGEIVVVPISEKTRAKTV